MTGLHWDSPGKKISSLQSPFVLADTEIIRFSDRYLKTVRFQLDIKQMFVTSPITASPQGKAGCLSRFSVWPLLKM